MKVTLVLQSDQEDGLKIINGELAIEVMDCNARYEFLEVLKKLLSTTIKMEVV